MIWICKETSNYMCQITVEECVWVCVWESFLSFMTEAFCTISCESLFFFMNHSDISVCLTDSSSVHHCSSSHWRYSSVITVNMYENLNTHTHTHVYMCVCVCIQTWISVFVCLCLTVSSSGLSVVWLVQEDLTVAHRAAVMNTQW